MSCVRHCLILNLKELVAGTSHHSSPRPMCPHGTVDVKALYCIVLYCIVYYSLWWSSLGVRCARCHTM